MCQSAYIYFVLHVPAGARNIAYTTTNKTVTRTAYVIRKPTEPFKEVKLITFTRKPRAAESTQ